jgi:hypothetical protein
VLLSDLLQNWSLLQTPVKNLISLLITIVISLAIGLLPGGLHRDAVVIDLTVDCSG